MTDDPSRRGTGGILAVGRGSSLQPPNRFERLHLEPIAVEPSEWDADDSADPAVGTIRKVATEFYDDESRSIIRENQSPDVPFRYSLNPYRGCEHGCAYCYARPTHEPLGWNAGIDFETRILVKRRAAELLRNELRHPSWKGEPIAISGVTDCYQPIERRLQITRQCLEVLVSACQAFSIITKNALVLRDLELLQTASRRNTIHVYLSITTLDERLSREMEPRTSSIAARFHAVRKLHAAGIPVAVMLAPIIPGFNDHEIPALLSAAKVAGAMSASWTMLRLPLTVQPVFLEWLETVYPEKRARVEARIRDVRDGRLSQSEFGLRHRGSGTYAEQIAKTFAVFARRHQLNIPLPDLDTTWFRRPDTSERQRLFGFMEDAP